jgi:hypothetical protein
MNIDKYKIFKCKNLNFKNRTGYQTDEGTGSLVHWSNHRVTGQTAGLNRV